MVKLKETSGCVQPTGRCHAALATVIIAGCDRPVSAGKWSCAVHAEQLLRRGDAIRAGYRGWAGSPLSPPRGPEKARAARAGG